MPGCPVAAGFYLAVNLNFWGFYCRPTRVSDCLFHG